MASPPPYNMPPYNTHPFHESVRPFAVVLAAVEPRHQPAPVLAPTAKAANVLPLRRYQRARAVEFVVAKLAIVLHTTQSGRGRANSHCWHTSSSYLPAVCPHLLPLSVSHAPLPLALVLAELTYIHTGPFTQAVLEHPLEHVAIRPANRAFAVANPIYFLPLILALLQTPAATQHPSQ